MEGPLLILKSWLLTGLAIWVYKRWFQRVAPPTPEFEAFCAKKPVIAALFDLRGGEGRAAASLSRRLGKRAASVATLGGFPWPHYRLVLAIETRRSAVLLRVIGAHVVRTNDDALPPLASLLREVLLELPDEAQGWLHPGAFNNGLVSVPRGGWTLERGTERHPRLRALEQSPDWSKVTQELLGEYAEVARAGGCGNSNWKQLPPSAGADTQILPPCASIARLQKASPSP